MYQAFYGIYIHNQSFTGKKTFIHGVVKGDHPAAFRACTCAKRDDFSLYFSICLSGYVSLSLCLSLSLVSFSLFLSLLSFVDLIDAHANLTFGTGATR